MAQIEQRNARAAAERLLGRPGINQYRSTFQYFGPVEVDPQVQGALEAQGNDNQVVEVNINGTSVHFGPYPGTQFFPYPYFGRPHAWSALDTRRTHENQLPPKGHGLQMLLTHNTKVTIGDRQMDPMNWGDILDGAYQFWPGRPAGSQDSLSTVALRSLEGLFDFQTYKLQQPEHAGFWELTFNPQFFFHYTFFPVVLQRTSMRRDMNPSMDVSVVMYAAMYSSFPLNDQLSMNETGQPLNYAQVGPLYIDDRFIGDRNAQLAIQAAISQTNRPRLDRLYLTFAPVVPFHVYMDAKRENPNAWAFSGASCGLAVAALFSGGASVMYTGYIKNFVENLDDGIVTGGVINPERPQLVGGRITQPEPSIVETALPNAIVENVDMLPWKMAFAIQSGFPLVIPYSDDMGRPIQPQLNSLRNSNQWFKLLMGDVMFTVADLLKGNNFAQFPKVVAAAVSTIEALALASVMWAARGYDQENHQKWMHGANASQLFRAQITRSALNLIAKAAGKQEYEAILADLHFTPGHFPDDVIDAMQDIREGRKIQKIQAKTQEQKTKAKTKAKMGKKETKEVNAAKKRVAPKTRVAQEPLYLTRSGKQKMHRNNLPAQARRAKRPYVGGPAAEQAIHDARDYGADRPGVVPKPVRYGQRLPVRHIEAGAFLKESARPRVEEDDDDDEFMSDEDLANALQYSQQQDQAASVPMIGQGTRRKALPPGGVGGGGGAESSSFDPSTAIMVRPAQD